MKKLVINSYLSRFMLFLALFLLFSDTSFSQKKLSKLKIISLKPNITEILFELGLGENIVGVTQYCDYPEEAKKIERVADFVSVHIEKTMSLQPTHIFGSKQNSNKKQIEFLQSQGQNIYLHDYYRLSEVEKSILKLGKVLDKQILAKEIVRKIKSDFSLLNQNLKKRPEVLLVVQTQPLIVVGNKNMIDDGLKRLKLKNVARSFNQRYPQITPEHLIAISPEVIIDMDMGGKLSHSDKLKYYGRYQSIPAVQNNNIFFLEASDFRPSSRITLGMKKLVDIVNQSHHDLIK